MSPSGCENMLETGWAVSAEKRESQNGAWGEFLPVGVWVFIALDRMLASELRQSGKPSDVTQNEKNVHICSTYIIYAAGWIFFF